MAHSANVDVYRHVDRIRGESTRQLSSKLPTNADAAPAIVPWSAAIGDLDTAFRFANTFTPGYPLTGTSEFLFIPQSEAMHRDPRFFALMKRYGLIQFWRSTDRWPDFCAGPRLPDCKASAAAALASR